MQNSLPQLHCPNLRCRAINTDRDQFCQKCGTYLPKRFLWAVGSGAYTFDVGDLLGDRFLFRGSQVVFDTQPGLPLKMDIDLPETLVPYLKLFPYRLHIPQIYTLLSLDEPSPSLLLLLEEVPLSNADFDASALAGSLSVGRGIPLFGAWPETQTLRQVHWLWQIAQLWQPLRIQGVTSSLLQPEFLRVEGPLLRLLELDNDFRLEPSLADLGQVWQQLIPRTEGKLATSLDALCEELVNGEIATSDLLVSRLEGWFEDIHKDYRVTIDIATRSDTGIVREHNEDACYPPDGSVAQNSMERMTIVCDGVGGHAGGEVASGIAIAALHEHLTQFSIDELSPAEVITALENASFTANDLICQRNDQEQRLDRQRMGTTLVSALSQKHQIYISHIGDSRAYLITPQGCYQVMVDDDIASREVRLGYVPYREALMQAASGSLVQALGMASSSVLRPTVQRFLLDEDCIFLLCSDGLSDYERVDMIWRDEILPLLQGGTDLAAVSKRLIELANQLNGHDNVTVGLVHCHVTHQRPGSNLASSGSSENSPTPRDTTAPDSPAPTVLPNTTMVVPEPPAPKGRGMGLLLILGLLVLGVGGVVAYRLGLVPLPFAQSQKSPQPASSSPATPPQQASPHPSTDLAQAQKNDVLRLVENNGQPVEIEVVQDLKDFGDISPSSPETSDANLPQPTSTSNLKLPSGSLVVIVDLSPQSIPTQPNVPLPKGDFPAIRIRSCRSVIDPKDSKTQQEGAGSVKPDSINPRGANPVPTAQFIVGESEAPDPAIEPNAQIVWVARSELEPRVDKIIPASQLSEAQREACKPSPVTGKEIPAGVSLSSEN
ncbi:MAG: SpoIIE family protein phosphatase [Acaryochloris sp. RU_4_1]|nr:SpoIIE family protein phosphatase [Acaryochloris sp. RU_4_1]